MQSFMATRISNTQGNILPPNAQNKELIANSKEMVIYRQPDKEFEMIILK
jgi:hypothetical protein